MRYWKIHAIGLGACLLAYRGEAVAAATPDPATRAHSYAVLERRIDHYVDQTKRAAILQALAEGRPAALAAPDDAHFIAIVNRTLAVSGDRHLSIYLKAPAPPAGGGTDTDFGIRRAERLADGTALLKIDGFGSSPEAVAAFDTAMAKLRGARALVLDLTDNGGGEEPGMLRLLGHLFPGRTEIAGIRWRQCAPPPPDRPDGCRQLSPRVERRFADAVAAPAFPDQPITVLVSRRTFSAGEAVAWELQTHRRAIIVGEVTGGGGNPSAGMDLESDFVVIMPIGTMVTPDGRSWEGRGVIPDVPLGGGSAMR